MDTQPSSSHSHAQPKKALGKFFALLSIIILIAGVAFTYFYVTTYFSLNKQLDSITKQGQTPSPTPKGSS